MRSDPEATVVTLINLAAADSHTVTVQAGAFGEHDIESVTYTVTGSNWAGHDTEYLAHPVVLDTATLDVAGPWLDVTLPPGAQVTLTLAIKIRVRPPSYRTPWSPPSASEPDRPRGEH